MPYISSKDKREAKKHMYRYKHFLVWGSLFLGILLLGVYSNSCISTKVCGAIIIDQYVREQRVLTVAPKKTLSVEVVDTKESRELGLSGRPKIEGTDGMLFVFDFPGRFAFWMKDMLFPIDIVWISKAGVVVQIEKKVQPDSYPDTFTNTIEALYVLELPVGEVDKYGLYLGSKIDMGVSK